MYMLTLDKRRRKAELKRDYYASDPDLRLAAINKARQQRGSPPVHSLEEAQLRLPPIVPPRLPRRGRPDRDERGRFA